MSKLGNTIKILAVPCMLVGLVIGAEAATGKIAKPASVVKMASGVDPVQAAPASVAVTPVVQASAPVASVPACARKVKVIYAGYGEADRAGCSVASAETTP